MKKNNKENLKRKHRITVNLNDREMRVFLRYCRKYKIKNRAQFIREAIFKRIIEDYNNDYPKLF